MEIEFHFGIPDQGSHWVQDEAGKKLEYTATQNFFHELSHARHKLNGTWRYFASEEQAVEEENLFRRQLLGQNGKAMRERFYVEGDGVLRPGACPEIERASSK